jgi:hypothetical protein
VASLKALFRPLLLFMDGWQIIGWDYPKIHPPGLDSDFQANKKVALTTLLVCRNTCPIWAFCGFPKSPGLSASFTYGRLANQGIGTHPKIHPPGLDSDFQADEKQYY